MRTEPGAPACRCRPRRAARGRAVPLRGVRIASRGGLSARGRRFTPPLAARPPYCGRRRLRAGASEPPETAMGEGRRRGPGGRRGVPLAGCSRPRGRCLIPTEIPARAAAWACPGGAGRAAPSGARLPGGAHPALGNSS